MAISLFIPARLVGLAGDFRPAGTHILQFARVHGGELTADAAALPPQQDQHHDRLNHRKRRTRTQWLWPAPSLRSSGNGPSTRSTRAESQYSLISLILPPSTRQTMQYWLS